MESIAESERRAGTGTFEEVERKKEEGRVAWENMTAPGKAVPWDAPDCQEGEARVLQTLGRRAPPKEEVGVR